jgi:16S rRNA (guanine1516-N2)-methyltransferase
MINPLSKRFAGTSGGVSVAILATAPPALAHELSLPSATETDSAYDLLLAWIDDHLELRDARDPRLKPFYVDFAGIDMRPYAASLSRRQPFARAMGKSKIIVDATGGFLQDALRLALMGFQVSAIERSSVVAALAGDGLRRLQQAHPTLGARLQYYRGDAKTVLPGIAPKPDVVYLDPMFPEKRRRSAAVRKELKWLRDLVGDDNDALELFDVARATATNRVVVKRPDHAPPLVPNPAASIAGKLVRYDIYSTRI